MRNGPSTLVLAAMLCASLLFSCSPEIETPPPPLPPDELSSSSETPSSSSPVALSSSSLDLSSSSSSSFVSSSSSLLAYNYCVFLEEKICLLGPMTSCPSGGVLSNSCPYGSSSSVSPSSSSILPSSSSVPQSSSSSFAGTSGMFKDDRDSKSYKWVKIGEQYWMAENLNYDATDSKCYNNSEANCTTYGKLYNWATAMALPASCNNSTCASQVGTKHKGICPAGWHIPSDAVWTTLTNFVGGLSTAGTKLKATSGWNNGGNGQDTYGFLALPSGYGKSGGYFYDVGYHGNWWSATEYNADSTYYRSLNYNSESVYRYYHNDKSYLFSVRCVQD